MRKLVVIAIATVALAGCGKTTSRHAVDASASVSFRVPVTSLRQLDMVVMIDNSPCSCFVTKMNAQFPKMIAALKDPADGTLPDLRIAIIDSDLGTGNAYASGSCGPKTLSDGTVSPYGDQGRFQMINATACGVNSSNSTYLEYKGGQPVNYGGGSHARAATRSALGAGDGCRRGRSRTLAGSTRTGYSSARELDRPNRELTRRPGSGVP